jgi:hypothetical protein
MVFNKLICNNFFVLSSFGKIKKQGILRYGLNCLWGTVVISPEEVAEPLPKGIIELTSLLR